MGNTPSKDIFSVIVQNLLAKDIDPNNHAYWDELWKTALSAEDLFDIFPAASVRKLIAERPANMKIIFTQAVAQLYQVVETPYPVYFEQALNCTRLLSRLLPLLLESKSKSVRQLLWSRRNPMKGSDAESAEDSEPLAVILVNTIFHMLFLPDFTVEDPNIDFTEKDINTPQFQSALMWAPGVGSAEKTVTHSTQFDSNRVDVLRLMIAAFSDSLYQTADNYDSCASLWLEVATSADAPYAEIVFYSLINTVLGYDPVGWGLPYGNLMTKDTAKSVMESAIQALIVLLDYGHPIRNSNNSSNDDDATGSQNTEHLPSVRAQDTEAPGFNIFRRFLGAIDQPDQLNFVYTGIVRLLNNVYQAQSTYLPYSITQVGIEQELLILFWKCLEENPRFMNFVLKNCDITEAIVPICYFMLEGRKDPSKVGLMYLCTFTLLKLSGERAFGVALNKAFQLHLPVDIPAFTGNHADLLIIVLHKLIVSGLDKLSALYSCFLTIICNISPYCKSLCTIASVKLVNLLQLFVSPRFLYAAEGNHVYVSMLLETLNNIVQYQYEGNGNTIYAIIRRKEVFHDLASLTLEDATRNAQEVASLGKVTSISAAAKPSSGSGSSSGGGSGSGGASTTLSATGKGSGTKLDSSSVEEEVPTPATPTDLISTAPVERRADSQHDVAVQDTASGARNRSASAAENRAANGEDTAGSTDETDASNVFMPTEEWLLAVKGELPLNTIMRLLKHLVPQLEKVAGKGHNLDEKAVTDFLRSTTMVGLLPVPHPIVIRKYQPNRYTCLWFTAFLWGVIFMHNQTLPLFDGKNVKLFLVQTV